MTGGRYEEHDHHSVGSGSLFARGSLKKRWRRGSRRRTPSGSSWSPLADAADDDSATGGPDVDRAIYPVVATVTVDGYHRIPDADLAAITAALRDQSDRGGAQGGGAL